MILRALVATIAWFFGNLWRYATQLPNHLLSNPQKTTAILEGKGPQQLENSYENDQLTTSKTGGSDVAESSANNELEKQTTEMGHSCELGASEDQDESQQESGILELELTRFKGSNNDLGPQSPNFAPSSSLQHLPPEILSEIIKYLQPRDLCKLAPSCRALLVHATSDLAWYRHVQENVPGVKLTTAFPCSNFRDLYLAHDPHWFLPSQKIWFSDYLLTGKLLIARYDPRRGCIEAYQLVAETLDVTFATWEFDDGVLIHSFRPSVRLHLDKPELKLVTRQAGSYRPGRQNTGPIRSHAESTSDRGSRKGFGQEIRMYEGPSLGHHGPASSFLLARKVPTDSSVPMAVWPPVTIPSDERVRNASSNGFSGSGHRPESRSQMCSKAFRIRRWIETGGAGLVGGIFRNDLAAQINDGERRTLGRGPVRLAEGISTFATLDEKLWTPTKDKPWRGIWVGDYAGHGCEFLLFHQPDDEEEGEDRINVKNRSISQRSDGADVHSLDEAPAGSAASASNSEIIPQSSSAVMASPAIDAESLFSSLLSTASTTTSTTPDLTTPAVSSQPDPQPATVLPISDASSPSTPSSSSPSNHTTDSSYLDYDDDNDDDDDYIPRQLHESTSGYSARRARERRIWRGKLEAIKLTGDANVPRGECTFVANDLGPAGFIRFAEPGEGAGSGSGAQGILFGAPGSGDTSSATTGLLGGARIVRSRGQLADRGFVRPRYTDSQLILVSENRIAQYWIEFGHVSFYERVDINQLLNPLGQGIS